uniref:Hydrolase n=1 Tax=Salmonella phage vB_SEnST11_KE23 TaxID=3161174 RepID=A0AAU8GGK4_9CAUD
MKTRMYCVVNQYIAGIHAGIQSAHAMTEVFLDYPQRRNRASNLLWDWADSDKTMIVLNGGYQSSLQELCEKLKPLSGTYPWASFCEEPDALNGAMTAVAVVLPEYMYNPQYVEISDLVYRPGVPVMPQVANTYRDEMGNTIHSYTQPEKDLITMIKSFRLKGE